jgi:hypothetical protein
MPLWQPLRVSGALKKGSWKPDWPLAGLVVIGDLLRCWWAVRDAVADGWLQMLGHPSAEVSFGMAAANQAIRRRITSPTPWCHMRSQPPP